MINKNNGAWQQKKAEVFWAEISPCEHLVQIYQNDTHFLDSLEAFVHAGLMGGEVTVVIATAAHLKAIEQRLKAKEVDVDAFCKTDIYIPMEAAHAMETFMIDSWPDEDKFRQFVNGIIARAKGKRLRAFGEMVALMWGQGFSSAAIRVEELWTELCQSESFSLFCAYPESGVTKSLKESVIDICNKHSTVIAGWNNKPNEVFYKTELL